MAANIQPKRKSVIKPGTNFSYNPATFAKEHKVTNFYETNRASDVLRLIKPFERLGRKFIVLDTEDFASKEKNHDLPANFVRRWIGSGKKAIPVDTPFCISLCDGTNAITLYDSAENGFAEFKKLEADILHNAEIEKIFHNTKFDMHMLANIGMKMIGKLHDTVVLAKLVNENRFSFALMDIASKLPRSIVKFEYMVDGYKKTYKIADYRAIPKELLSEYANADVWNTFLVFDNEFPLLVTDELTALYDNELEDMIALWAMERFGMAADPTYEFPLKTELQQLADAAEEAVYAEAGQMFNINSTKQLYAVMMRLGVDPNLIKFTDAGNPSLDKNVLAWLAEVHDVSIVVKVLEFRKYEKLLGTYANGIYDQRDAAYKVHGSINQTEATTGRMSITKPALQTLPKKDKRIRRLFVPSAGFRLYFMDLDQIEYRLLAHYAQAVDLIAAIKRGWDVHQATAAVIYNVPYEEVTEEQRTRAKTINFSLVYGQGDEATANSLKVTLQEARAFKSKYFAQIPEVGPFIATVHKVVRSRGFVKNFYGRRRRLKTDEAYKAPNALIQGCAADYIKHRLILMYKFLQLGGYKTRLVNIVHDEMVIEIHESELHLAPKLRWLMSDFETFRVPITAGVDTGNPSWGEKETEDCGFEALTAEEMEAVRNVNVFDGSVFNIGNAA
jgi:DNA polymerase I